MFVYKVVLLCLLQILVLCSVAVFADNHEENYCLVHIPNSTFTVNVTQKHDYIMKFSDTTDEYIEVNLCTPLSHMCAHRNGYAACFHDTNGIELGIGKFPPALSLNAGNIVFSFEGDQCNATHKFITQFKLECDLYEEDSFYIENEDFTSTPCEFNIVFKTAIACKNRQQYSCAVKHQTNNYSLDRLRNHKINYFVAINRTLSVVLNVCENLVYWKQNTNCGSNSAICLVDQSNYHYTKYTNLGNIEDHEGIEYITDGVIKIEYKNGAVCKSDKRKRLQSTIRFICDLNSKESYPEYIGGLESCELQFVWKTAAACSEEKLINSSLATRGNCNVADPISGYIYDFLYMHEDNMHTLTDRHDDSQYQFGVCNAIDSQCATGSGVCKTSKKTHLIESGGIANSQLLWSPKMGLYLNYTEGDKCSTGQRKSTVIELTCADTNFVDIIENHCNNIIKFLTKTACPKVCSYFRHTQFDNLMNSAVEYKIKRNKTAYSFNICVSIHQMEYFNCMHGGAGICKSTHHDENGIQEFSLGYPEPLPIVISERETALKFVNGSVCGQYGTTNISSQISLICDVNATNSFPDFDRYEKCIYHFTWRSRQSCGIIDCTINDDCSIENELGHRWVLKSLRRPLIRNVQSTRGNNTYKVSLCGKSDTVKDSSIFTKDMKFGKLLKVSADYTKNITLKLYFSHGTVCDKGYSRARSVLHLICDETRDPGEPVLLWEEECSVAFEWRTRLICSPKIKIPQTSKSFWSSGVTGFVVFVVLIMTAGVSVFLARKTYYGGIFITYVRNTCNRFIVYPRIYEVWT